MAYTAWTASTAYAVGDVVRPTTQTGFGLVFRCNLAGTSGATEPDWPTKILQTDTIFTSFTIPTEGYIDDGTTFWVAVSAVSEELQALAPSAIIELFELQLISGTHYDPASPPATTTYYFHAGTNELSGNVTWNGQAYTRFPVQMEGFEYSGAGQLPTPTLRVANLNGLLTLALMEVNAYTPGNDLINARVTRIRTLKKYLDAVNFTGGTNPTADPYAELPREVYFISRKVSENRNLIEWQLASVFDMQGVKAPKRQAISRCQWTYKSSECSYTPVNSFSGTWTRIVDYLTVTATAHGLITSDAVYLTGIPQPGIHVVISYNANTFSVRTANTGASSGTVTATQWFDSSDEPTFVAANDVCPKRLTSCEARFSTALPLPFGGFPGVGQFS
jgi:lambda family phage minor tail protein L